MYIPDCFNLSNVGMTGGDNKRSENPMFLIQLRPLARYHEELSLQYSESVP